MKKTSIFISALLTLVYVSTIFLLPANVVFGQRQTALNSIVKCENPPNCNLSDLINTVNSAINFLVIISASIAAIMFITAGFLYMTAGGDTGKVGQAHKIFQATAIGFAIVVGGWLIIKMVISGLSIDDNFQNILPDNS